MEIITRFQAADGAEFSDANDCEEHERLCREIDLLMKRLPTRPNDDSGFWHGVGFIQHSPLLLMKVRSTFYELVRDLTGDYLVDSIAAEPLEPRRSHLHQSFGDSLRGNAAHHWRRFECIDEQFREWGQSYFANHPEKGKQRRLNPLPVKRG